MLNTFHLTVSTPDKIAVDKDVVQVTIPTALGQTGILSKHADIVGVVEPGKLHIIYPDNKEDYCILNHGVFSFKNNKLVILSDFYKVGEDYIDEQAFEDVRLQIEKGMKDADLTENMKKVLSAYIKKIGTEVKRTKQKR